MAYKTVMTMEELQKQIRDIVFAISCLPFSVEAKEELLKIIESHSSTAFETIKRIHESYK